MSDPAVSSVSDPVSTVGTESLVSGPGLWEALGLVPMSDGGVSPPSSSVSASSATGSWYTATASTISFWDSMGTDDSVVVDGGHAPPPRARIPRAHPYTKVLLAHIGVLFGRCPPLGPMPRAEV